MLRQDHWNKVGGGGGVDRIRELCDMVSVNIIINILVHINVHEYMIYKTNNLYHYIYISQNVQ